MTSDQSTGLAIGHCHWSFPYTSPHAPGRQDRVDVRPPIVVVASVGWYFYKKLDQPGCGTTSPPTLAGAGRPRYLVAYTVWGLYYVILLNNQGAHAPAGTGLRAYFISQMGKYVPGKFWVIVIRVGMLRGIGITPDGRGHHGHVREPGLGRGRGPGRGRPLARLALGGAPDQAATRGWALPGLHRAWLILPVALAPIGMVGLNRFVNRVRRWTKGADAKQYPRVKLHVVLFGLAFDALGWLVLGGCLMLILVSACSRTSR